MLVDLSHIIYSGMPVFPGTRMPEITPCASISEQGYNEHWLSLAAHTGTHIDAPAHVIEGGRTLDLMPLQRFSGQGVTIDCTGVDTLSLPFLKRYGPLPDDTDFLLFYTGWQDKWGTDSYFSGFPLLTPEAAGWLSQLSLSGIGFDTPSADATDSVDLPIHKQLAGRGLLLIENLTHLERIPSTGFTFFCMPLFISHSDGSPVRAFAAF